MRKHPDAWIQTYSGRQFWPLEPDSNDVNIIDIAHPLSLICRYSGHSERFYSVGQHCVELALYGEEVLKLPPKMCLYLLLHDSSEAYICDIPRPAKLIMPEYKGIEAKLEECIFTAFGLEYPMPNLVNELDTAMLATEAPVLMKKPPVPWGAMDVQPLPIKFMDLDMKAVEVLYLKLFNRYSSLSKNAA